MPVCNFSGMSTLAEIEQAIETLPPPQVEELAVWLEQRRFQKAAANAEHKEFRAWLAASTGLAKGKLTTDERMRETRGED